VGETQESIVKWMFETFPGADPESPRKALRALEEMVELCLAAGAAVGQIAEAVGRSIGTTVSVECEWGVAAAEPAKVPAEAADVLIVLYGLAGLRGFDLHAEVDRKMQKNRSRVWRTMGDGTGYHIKDESRLLGPAGEERP
jgi:NTP pyrophosphatase (non-canonical NTP hydrolase)